MKRLIGAGVTLAVIAAIVMVTFTSCTFYVEPGYEGIKIDKLGKTREVGPANIVVGRGFYNPWTTDIVTYPISVQRVVWTANPNEGASLDESIGFTTKDSISLRADVAISIFVEPGKSPQIYNKYRKTLAELIDTQIRDVVRGAIVDTASRKTATEILGEGLTGFQTEVLDRVQERLAREGFIVDNFQFIDRIVPPDNIQTEIERKIQAEQAALAAQQKVVQVQAEAQQKIAEAEGLKQAKILEAEGEAEALRILNDAVKQNPEVLRLRTIEKWDGVLPRVLGNEAGLNLLLPIEGTPQ
jgi:regulator of protease activity HflC (stomatin/prohibitin superfamily)